MVSKAETQEDFVKVDLHIHTPASHDYKGARNENEYLQILREAKSKSLRIIAITDHNSIEGYKAILKLKDKLSSQRESLSSITDSEQTRKSLRLIEGNLSLFDDLLILPGIEFEVNNGIHLLIIFSNDVPLQRIEKLLLDGGYTPTSFGEKEPSVIPNWDIFAFYEESRKYDCIIIDAHTDSTKGILDTIPKGMARANCFRSPQLYAVCYNSETQKDKLKSTLQSGKDYSRTFPLSFVRFSDSHIASDVGSVSTWVKVDSLSLESLKKAFTNPSENVSTEEPSTMKILDELIELPNSFGISDLTKESKDLCKKCICSLLNSDGGYILLGVTQQKNKVGIPLSDTTRGAKDKYKPIVNDIASCVTAIEPLYLPSLSFYPLQNNRVIISLHVPAGDTLASIKNDNRIYSFSDGNIKLISAPDIQSKIEQKTLIDVEQRVFRRIAAVENDCTFIKNVFSTLPLMRIFEKRTREVNFNVSVPSPIKITPLQRGKLEKALIVGASKGNLFFLHESQSPRLPYTYLRYSLPLFTLQQLRLSSSPQETIYIVPGGGVYYSKRDYPFFLEENRAILKLHKSTNNSRYGMKFTVCFLKSTLLLWHLINKFDDIDLFQPKTFRKLRFPVINMRRPESVKTIREIEDSFDKILNLEGECLIAVRKCKGAEAQQNLLDQHNKKVDELAYSIDLNFYSLLGLSQDSVKVIEDNIRLNKIYIPEFSDH